MKLCVQGLHVCIISKVVKPLFPLLTSSSVSSVSSPSSSIESLFNMTKEACWDPLPHTALAAAGYRQELLRPSTIPRLQRAWWDQLATPPTENTALVVSVRCAIVESLALSTLGLSGLKEPRFMYPTAQNSQWTGKLLKANCSLFKLKGRIKNNGGCPGCFKTRHSIIACCGIDV